MKVQGELEWRKKSEGLCHMRCRFSKLALGNLMLLLF